MKKYENYVSALNTLSTASEQDLENEFVQSGVIDKFSLQFELGWKLLKDLLAYEGDRSAATESPRDIIKAASAYYDFMDEEVWLAMLRDRNNTAHVYDESSANQLVKAVIDQFIPEFVRLNIELLGRYGDLLAATGW